MNRSKIPEPGDVVRVNKRQRIFTARLEEHLRGTGKAATFRVTPLKPGCGYFHVSVKDIEEIVEKAPPTKLTIRIPGKVWDDFLDPSVSGMQAELQLGAPRHITRGRGTQAIYDDVPAEAVRDLIEYLRDRGDTLLGQGINDPYDPEEKAQRDVYRAAIKVANSLSESLH